MKVRVQALEAYIESGQPLFTLAFSPCSSVRSPLHLDLCVVSWVATVTLT